jgi:ribosomal protein S18 acetylase RimI-like enzyme
MTDTLSSLYRLRRVDLKKAAEVFARAFHDDALAKYLFPNDDYRTRILPTYFSYRIKFGLLYGEVYAPTSAIEGLAVWYRSDQHWMNNWRNFRAGGLKLMLKVDKETMKRMLMINKFTTKLRDYHIPADYWYLAPLGIDPEHQGKGFCSKLMRAMLNRIDSEKMVTVLETQSKTNLEIYQRYGFEIVKQIFLPDTSINHWLMVRKANQSKID